MTSIECKRRAMCEELEIAYDVVCNSGRLLAMLDRTIELRDAMPSDVAENLATIERHWSQTLKVTQ